MATVGAEDINRAAVYALRHYVTLSYYIRSTELLEQRGGVAQPIVCSAFVMRVRNIWCLVTAGHVLNEIDGLRSRGYELVSFRLTDAWHTEATFQNFIPFAYDSRPKLRIDKDGLDYGLIPLGDYYGEHLKANGIVPLGEEHYEKKWPEDQFDAYAMIGVPAASVALEHLGGKATRFSQSTAILHIEKDPNPPPQLVEAMPRFYGRIVAPVDSEIWKDMGESIAGMSGGPIIAIRGSGRDLSYWVIGVQSGWLESERIIAASPFQDFARAVGEILDGNSP